MPEPIIRAKGVNKTYPGKKALDSFGIEINRGETFGLIGPNGAGKTTFIRLLVGLLKFDSGEIEVFGKQLPDRSILPRIGYMTQKEAVYDDLTVYENMEFFAALYDVPVQLMGVYIDTALNVTDMLEYRRMLAASLSGGLKQRLSLSIALVHQPELLILDEPTVGVDPELRLTFWDYFKDLNKKGITILLTTHNLDEAIRSDRLGMIHHGKMMAIGNGHELIAAAKVKTLDEAFLFYARNGG